MVKHGKTTSSLPPKSLFACESKDFSGMGSPSVPLFVERLRISRFLGVPWNFWTSWSSLEFLDFLGFLVLSGVLPRLSGVSSGIA